MGRFYVENINHNDCTARISENDARHAKKVLRMQPGEKIVVFDGKANEYTAEIVEYFKDGATVKIVEKIDRTCEAQINITIFQGIPKSDKMDYIIQKCTELGVSRFVPVITERTVVRFQDEKDKVKKVERWQRIAVESAKQSGRNTVPQVDMPVVFDEAVKMAGGSGLYIIPYEKETENKLRTELNKASNIREVGVYIGPEGGFSEKEIHCAISEGIKPVTLGKRIFRTETAGIVVSAIILYENGDI